MCPQMAILKEKIINREKNNIHIDKAIMFMLAENIKLEKTVDK
jgi:hypothetical protein